MIVHAVASTTTYRIIVIKLDTAATANNMLQFHYKARDFFHNYYYATWHKVYNNTWIPCRPTFHESNFTQTVLCKPQLLYCLDNWNRVLLYTYLTSSVSSDRQLSPSSYTCCNEAHVLLVIICNYFTSYLPIIKINCFLLWNAHASNVYTVQLYKATKLLVKCLKVHNSHIIF